jgi:hypothetical protein
MSISQRTLTSGEVAGNGIFDELMRTVKAHVHLELSQGRITEQAYSQVYLGALQNVLQVATQYSLQFETTNKQSLLMDEQIAQAVIQKELLVIQKNQAAVDLTMAEFNRDSMQPQQLALLTAQSSQVTTQTGLTDKQVLQAVAQTSLVGKQEDLVDEQIEAAKDQTVTPTGGTNLAAYNKTLAETEILTQKKLTEQAQIEGTFIGADGGTIGGLVGVEMSLKTVQKESFLRDAEQKAAKMYTDVFATMYASNSDDAYAQPENFGYDFVTGRNVMDKLLTGVGTFRHTSSTIPSTGVGVPKVDNVPITYPRTIETI